MNGLRCDRQVFTGNGRRVLLHPTGKRTESVAGVHIKAWNSPSGLHSTTAAHSPLIFEVVDTWNRQSPGAPPAMWPTWGAQREQLPGQRVRGREPSHRPLPAHGPHARAYRCSSGRAHGGASRYTRSAPSVGVFSTLREHGCETSPTALVPLPSGA